MKTYLLAALLVASSAFGQGRPAPDIKGFFRGDIGPALTKDFDTRFFPGAGSVEIELDPGFQLGIAGGAEFGPFFALGFETGFVINGIDDIEGFTDVDGYVSRVPFLVNAMFQFKNNSGLTPFIGAGAGGAATGITLDDADAPTVEVDGSAGDVGFAWQAFGGLKYELNDQISVGIMYKYLWSDDGEWEVDDAVQDIEFEGLRSHSLSAVVSFTF